MHPQPQSFDEHNPRELMNSNDRWLSAAFPTPSALTDHYDTINLLVKYTL